MKPRVCEAEIIKIPRPVNLVDLTTIGQDTREGINYFIFRPICMVCDKYLESGTSPHIVTIIRVLSPDKCVNLFRESSCV